MSNFEYGYASPDAPDPRGSNPEVLKLCTHNHMSQLLYMRFDSWDQAAGYSTRNAFKDQSPAVKKAIQTICQPQKSYHMEIWFLAPFDAERFRRVCLCYFIDSLKTRVNTLCNWQDGLGNRYIDRQIPSQLTARADKRMRKMMFRERKAPRAQDIETAQGVENAAHMLAQDDSVAGRSTSPRPEEQTMLTSRAGPTSPSAEEQITSAPSPPREFVMPTSQPLRPRYPIKGFLPEFMMGSLDVSDVATYNDSNIEPEPVVGSDDVEEGQQKDEEEGSDPAR